MKIDIHSKKLESLFADLENTPALPSAIVWPSSKESLQGAIAAAEADIIAPILIGDRVEITEIATQAKLDLSRCKFVTATKDTAVKIAIQTIKDNEAVILMKGSLSSNEFMGDIVNRESGLRLKNRMSLCVVTDIPLYKKPIIITDPGLNIAPTLLEKKDILQNAIDLAHALGIKMPKVALLAATEKILEKMPSTIESKKLSDMAKTGEISGAIIDGPMAFDVAFSAEAAASKKISSPVAGDPDVLLMPNIEAGNILYKAVEYMAGAIGISLVVGAKIPIILTSRSASITDRVGSCLLAALYHRYLQSQF